MSQANCIFCSILRGDIPSTQLYSDEHVVSFLDIGPVNRGHALVIPRAHYETLFDLPLELAAPITSALQRVGNALMKATGAEGINILQNNFTAAGQVVFHVHWHIIPRFSQDGLTLWPQGQYDTPEAMQVLAESIRRSMN